GNRPVPGRRSDAGGTGEAPDPDQRRGPGELPRSDGPDGRSPPPPPGAHQRHHRIIPLLLLGRGSGSRDERRSLAASILGRLRIRQSPRHPSRSDDRSAGAGPSPFLALQPGLESTVSLFFPPG